MASNPFNSAENTNSGAKQEKMNVHRQMMENKLRAGSDSNERWVLCLPTLSTAPKTEQGLLTSLAMLSGNPANAYVSPSDAIMSPASQKLSGFKQRQMNKS
jgi:hypothetical protein